MNEFLAALLSGVIAFILFLLLVALLARND